MFVLNIYEFVVVGMMTWSMRRGTSVRGIGRGGSQGSVSGDRGDV